MMIGDDNDGQMIFGDLRGLKLPDICLTGEEKPRKNLTQKTCPDQGSNPGPLRDRCACYHLSHSGGLHILTGDIYLVQGVREISAIILTDVLYVVRNQKVFTMFFLF